VFTFQSFIYRDGAYHFIDSEDSIFQVLAINNSLEMAVTTQSSAMPPEARIGYLIPVPELTSSGRDGPVTVAPGAPHGLQGTMTAFSFPGWQADWWLVAQTPSGTYSYDVASRSWRPGFFRSAGLPLRDVGPLNLPSAGGAPGVYMYFLGADLKRNAAFDTRYLSYDILTVIQR
jgi:hypothetical protein